MYIKKPIKRIAVIHDLCGLGKAALINIIPILSIMGFEVCPIPTMLLSTHTGGLGKPYTIRTKNYLKETILHYKKLNIEFEGIIIGYIGDKNLINDVLTFVKEFKKHNTKIIFDPVFGDNGNYYSNFDVNYMNSIKKIIEYSDVITPNYTEACYLSFGKYTTKSSENHINSLVNAINCKNIVITSMLDKDTSKISTLLYEKGVVSNFSTDKLEKSYPGTGDIFVSVLAGHYLSFDNLKKSTEKAVEFTFDVIKYSNKFNYDSKFGVLLEPNLIKLL